MNNYDATEQALKNKALKEYLKWKNKKALGKPKTAHWIILRSKNILYLTCSNCNNTIKKGINDDIVLTCPSCEAVMYEVMK